MRLPGQEPTNNDRARWANTALSAFVNEVGDSGDEDTNIADLLCDLMHLCDAHGFDFERVLASGRIHYDAETTGAEGQPKADASFAEGDF